MGHVVAYAVYLRTGKSAAAHRFNAQLLKALLQSALDNGDWRNAALMIPTGTVALTLGKDLEGLHFHSHRPAVNECLSGNKTWFWGIHSKHTCYYMHILFFSL